MKIGIVTTWFERGASYVSKAYLETLSEKHDVFIYARAGERYAQGDPDWDKDYVTWGKAVPGKIVTYVDFEDFKGWVLRNGIEMIIFNEQHSWEILLEAKKLKLSLGAYIDYYTPETVPFFGIYDFLLCNTNRHYGLFKDHPHAIYVPWGTDVDAYHPSGTAHDCLTFFHSCGGSPVRKGTDLTIKAFRQVRGDVKLIIHTQWDLQFNDELAGILAEDKRIEIIHKEVGKPGLYYLGDVYVYPSRLEGIGLTMAEALASGLPVITTDAPPMNEFVFDGLDGKLVPAETVRRRSDNYYWPETICNEGSLTKAMQFYVDNCERLGDYKTSARQFAVSNLDWKKNSRDLPSLIEKMPCNSPTDKRLLASIRRYERSRYGKLQTIRSIINRLSKRNR